MKTSIGIHMSNLRETDRKLQPLVRETRRVIARIAEHSITAIQRIPADVGSQQVYSTFAFGEDGLFPNRTFTSAVSPKISALRTIPGISGAVVDGAELSFDARARYFPSVDEYLKLPYGRKPKRIDVHIGREDDASHSGITLGVSQDGHARVRGKVFGVPHGSGNYGDLYSSPGSLERTYSRAYSSALAVAGIVGASMYTFETQVDTSNAQDLFNEWREIGGQDPYSTTMKDFWVPVVESSDALQPLLRANVGDSQ